MEYPISEPPQLPRKLTVVPSRYGQKYCPTASETTSTTLYMRYACTRCFFPNFSVISASAHKYVRCPVEASGQVVNASLRSGFVDADAMRMSNDRRLPQLARRRSQ